MSRYKNGNPKRSSWFLCLHCMKINQLGTGIQRIGHQREKYHVKDLMCVNPGCNGLTTKNLEIRWCDTYEDVYKKALRLRENYYPAENNMDREDG